MRILGFLMFVAGLALSFAWQPISAMVANREIGRWALIDAEGHFAEPTIPLALTQSPVGVEVEMTVGGTYVVRPGSAALTLTADHAGKTILAEPLTFDGAEPMQGSAQGHIVLRQSVGTIEPLTGGDYHFVPGPGDALPDNLVSAVLVLRANAVTDDSLVEKTGTGLIWAGAILFVIGLRRRNRRDAAPPPPPQWGRG